jgi:hypothetical protein
MAEAFSKTSDLRQIAAIPKVNRITAAAFAFLADGKCSTDLRITPLISHRMTI